MHTIETVNHKKEMTPLNKLQLNKTNYYIKRTLMAKNIIKLEIIVII